MAGHHVKHARWMALAVAGGALAAVGGLYWLFGIEGWPSLRGDTLFIILAAPFASAAAYWLIVALFKSRQELAEMTDMVGPRPLPSAWRRPFGVEPRARRAGLDHRVGTDLDPAVGRRGRWPWFRF